MHSLYALLYGRTYKVTIAKTHIAGENATPTPSQKTTEPWTLDALDSRYSATEPARKGSAVGGARASRTSSSCYQTNSPEQA